MSGHSWSVLLLNPRTLVVMRTCLACQWDPRRWKKSNELVAKLNVATTDISFYKRLPREMRLEFSSRLETHRILRFYWACAAQKTKEARRRHGCSKKDRIIEHAEKYILSAIKEKQTNKGKLTRRTKALIFCTLNTQQVFCNSRDKFGNKNVK